MTLRVDMEFDKTQLASLHRKLGRYAAKVGPMPQVMADPVDQFLYNFGHSVLDHADRRAPTDTGKMKRSLRFNWLPWAATVRARTPGGWVDQGTKPHWPPVAALKGWAKRHGMNPYAVAAGIAKHGTKKTEWFTAAVEDAKRELPRRLRKCVAGIETEWRG